MAKRSHAGSPEETSVPPYGLCYEGNNIPLISVSTYAKKYNVPETTVRYWIRKKRIHAIYQKGKYGIADVHPRELYRHNCYNDPGD